jgi:polyhydroxyalkanoate synthesis repressor PhaR
VRWQIGTNQYCHAHRGFTVTTKSRLIQKYNNRRLYDTLEHRYITLHDVHQMVLNNVEFYVLDRQSRSDITASVLLDVIVAAHAAQRGEPGLDRSFLIDVIRKYCVSGPERRDTSSEYTGTEPGQIAQAHIAH